MNGSVSVSPSKCNKNRQFKVASAQTHHWQQHEAGLIIDITGRIIECSPAAMQLLGQQPDALFEHDVTEIIPELPFAQDTPIYNLAYAVFHSSDGQMMQHSALLANGNKIFIAIVLSSTVMNGRRHITLNLTPSIKSVSEGALINSERPR